MRARTPNFTHTHTRTYVRAYARVHIHAHTHSLSLTHSLTHTHTPKNRKTRERTNATKVHRNNDLHKSTNERDRQSDIKRVRQRKTAWDRITNSTYFNFVTHSDPPPPSYLRSGNVTKLCQTLHFSPMFLSLFYAILWKRICTFSLNESDWMTQKWIFYSQIFLVFFFLLIFYFHTCICGFVVFSVCIGSSRVFQYARAKLCVEGGRGEWFSLGKVQCVHLRAWLQVYQRAWKRDCSYAENLESKKREESGAHAVARTVTFTTTWRVGSGYSPYFRAQKSKKGREVLLTVGQLQFSPRVPTWFILRRGCCLPLFSWVEKKKKKRRNVDCWSAVFYPVCQHGLS